MLFFPRSIPVAALLMAASAITVTATPSAPVPTSTDISQCATGHAVCCNNVGDAHSNTITTLLGLLGIVLGDVTGLVGLGCTPISVGSGVACASQPVCCAGVEFNGLVNIGCTPITP